MWTGISLLPKVFLDHVGNGTKFSVPVADRPGVRNDRDDIIPV